MNPMLRSGAFFPALGNHERENPDELRDYVLRFFGGAGEGGKAIDETGATRDSFELTVP